MLLNQSEVWLPAAIKKQILEAEAGEKGKGVLFKVSVLWENGGLPVFRLIRLTCTKPRQNSAIPSKTKTKDSA